MTMTLKEHRERAYLTTRELAEKAGITTPTLWRLENMNNPRSTARAKVKRLPHATTMRKVAAALGVEPSDIAEFERKPGRQVGEQVHP